MRIDFIRSTARRRIAAVFGASVLVTGAFAVVSSPASAAPSCASGVACAFEHIDFEGQVFTAVFGQRGVCHNFPSWMDNKTSSVSNSTSKRVVWYKGLNCTGQTYARAAGYASDDMRLTGINDAISSVRIDA
jgi:hypothetical protein